MLFPFLTRVEKNKIPKWWFVVAFFLSLRGGEEKCQGRSREQKAYKGGGYLRRDREEQLNEGVFHGRLKLIHCSIWQEKYVFVVAVAQIFSNHWRF